MTSDRRGVATVHTVLLGMLVFAGCARTRHDDATVTTSAGASTPTAAPAATPPSAPPPAPVTTSPAASGSATVPSASAPRITRLVPDSAQVGRNSVVEVLIKGSGFARGASGSNTVDMGPVHLTNVPANDTGTEIRFVIPDRIVSRSESAPRRLLPGAYPVTVTTTAGTSNAYTIQVLP